MKRHCDICHQELGDCRVTLSVKFEAPLPIPNWEQTFVTCGPTCLLGATTHIGDGAISALDAKESGS
jgi:hypothetical protein